jgi:hypothetical protein
VLGLIATAVILALPPAVAIDTSGLDEVLGPVDAGQFHGQLALRLVEDGFAVGGEPDARLSFSVEADRVVIVATSDAGDASATVRLGDAAPILTLELVHRSAALLLALGVERSNDAAVERGVVLDTANVDPAIPAELARRVVDRGHVLVRDAQAARWRICVDGREGGFAVAVVAAGASCDEALDDAEVVADPHRGMESALLSATWPEDSAPPADDRTPPPARDADAVAPSSAAPAVHRRVPWRFGLGAFGGVEGRLRTGEGVAGLVADAVHPIGVSMMGRLTLVPSRGADLRVFDTFIAFGPGFRSRVRGRVSFGTALLAGLYVHRYRFADDVGHSLDVDIEVALGLGIQLHGGLDLTVDALAGVVPRRTEHHARTQLVWTRDRVRLGGALGLRYTWGR